MISNRSVEVGLGDICVVYKTNNFIAVNKHFDVRINSDDPQHTVTVEHQLRYSHPELVDPEVQHGFRFQHRLDHATSGVLCLALNKKSAAAFQKSMQNRTATKHYLALVRGHVTAQSKGDIQTIDIDIGRDGAATDVYKMCTSESPHCKGALSAQTGLVVLQHGAYDGEPASKVLLVPRTGRSHQLRVHCKHIGHLIVGDFTYSDRKDTKPYRMMLHALRLLMPLSLEPLDIVTPDPFTPDVDPLWIPSQTFITYDEFWGINYSDKELKRGYNGEFNSTDSK